MPKNYTLSAGQAANGNLPMALMSYGHLPRTGSQESAYAGLPACDIIVPGEATLQGAGASKRKKLLV
jgi:hypothetical protein